MTPADVEPATEAIRRGGWGERGPFFAFAVGHRECDPILAEVDDEIVGTGVGTASGHVGWIGAIFVGPTHRGHGLGLALTAEVIARLESRGCRTLVLVATEQGRPIYERLGFEVQSWYHTLEIGGLPMDAPPDRTVQAIGRADLPGMAALDRRATGEDRAHLIEAFVRDDAGWIVRDPDDGHLRAFLLRAPWGGGATIAPDPSDALRLLDHRRAVGGPDHRVRAGLMAENEAGRLLLAERGWTEAWSAVRMIRGDPLDWQPEAIWGQFNHAIG
jgi:GNAT superfamily N-acetyltransferase